LPTLSILLVPVPVIYKKTRLRIASHVREMRLLLLAFYVSGLDALLIGVGRPVPVPRGAVAMQLAPSPTKTRTFQRTDGGGSGKGGGAPTVNIAKPKMKEATEDVPMWKVILLFDEDYEEDPVRPPCEPMRQAGIVRNAAGSRAGRNAD